MLGNDELADRLRGIQVIEEFELCAELVAPQSRRLSNLALPGPRMQWMQHGGELATSWPHQRVAALADVDGGLDRSIFASLAFWLGGGVSIVIWTGFVLALVG
jgi:hypothetical protein